jgi:hypothetical protein
MERQLARWKRMYLSKGGRLTLLKSTLFNILLWGGIEDEAKFHLVNWNRICTPIKSGGLGVQNFIQFNQALLGKWLSRYAREREAFWRLVIEAKFESLRGGWCSKEVLATFGVGV